jgi:streptogramin lyase
MFYRSLTTAILLFTASFNSNAITITDEDGQSLARVMVTQTVIPDSSNDISDGGYTPAGVTNNSAITITRFTNIAGQVNFDATDAKVKYRARAQGYVDAYFAVMPAQLSMQKMTQQQYIASFPSNVWLSQMKFEGDQELKKIFQLNCSFCHQQASPFMRNERTTEQWITVFNRMNTFGSRLPEEEFDRVANILQTEYRYLRENSHTVPEPKQWEDHLTAVEYTEWPIGDGFSQMHDFLLHPNGLIYVGDNLHDRIYEINPASGDYTVYKVPHSDNDKLGGILGNRFTTFPKMENYYGVHSFSLSPKDGNIFITPSMQQALLEFNPKTKEFTVHRMDEGYYPHTIRSAANDDVWFTLALSSQVAKFNRTTEQFTLYDLPARNLKEWFIIKSLPLVFWFEPENRPTPSGDREGNGLPMPYGIDISPDGSIWVTRLYANDLAHIDPDTDQVTMIDFPYAGPRRLRVDADNNVWIVAFQDSLLVKYEPKTKAFTKYELPVVNEIPYALNVDRARDTVWVNGNQSDTIMAFDINNESWKTYPMPRQRFFTRDIEIAEEDGSIYTTNSHFPTWQSEGGVPTLLKIEPIKTQQ